MSLMNQINHLEKKIAAKDPIKAVIRTLKTAIPTADIYRKDPNTAVIGTKDNKKIKFIISVVDGSKLKFSLDLNFDDKRDPLSSSKHLPWDFTHHKDYSLEDCIKTMTKGYPSYVGLRKEASVSFKVGDIVTIKPKYRNKDEKDERYEVVEWNGDRGFISPLVWDWKIKPQELVRGYQLEKV